MTTTELKKEVEEYNKTNFPKIEVDSPMAYSQYRLCVKVAGVWLLGWTSVDDAKDDDRKKDIKLV